MLKYQSVKSITRYLLEVRAELSKVVWPKRSDVMKLTATVVVITLLVGAYVGVLDLGFAKLLESVIKN
ncbi:preprotein translocase subunit SecE [Candidatus Microgenomates bacterium]|nr:MAG: preprotein translocase subunit SecE [Candidatus Microgenomates bacterium]